MIFGLLLIAVFIAIVGVYIYTEIKKEKQKLSSAMNNPIYLSHCPICKRAPVIFEDHVKHEVTRLYYCYAWCKPVFGKPHVVARGKAASTHAAAYFNAIRAWNEKIEKGEYLNESY